MLAQLDFQECSQVFTRTINHPVDHSIPSVIVNHMVDNPLDQVFSALADPTRRAILLQLLAGDLTVKQVAADHDMSLAAVSKHLQILTRAGVVRQNKQGREKICQLEPESLRAVSLWMEGFGAFSQLDFDGFEGRLDDLGLNGP